MPQRPVQLWLFTPDAPELAASLPAERVVYYCVDDFAGFSGYNAPLVELLERQTIAASHVVITTSLKLYEERRNQHPGVHFVPHGVDFDHFAATPALPDSAVPDELRRLPHPVFGYMGQVCDYMDFELLATAARARPEWSFVLLGDVRCQPGPVATLPNVHLLGGRPYADLPRYCRGFDVGLIPFRLNRLTRAVNPIKLQEYLAAGLPVVSAPLAAVLRYAPAVQLAASLDEFLTACAAALALRESQSPAAIQELVRTEGWAARVAELSSIVMSAGAATETPVSDVASALQAGDSGAMGEIAPAAAWGSSAGADRLLIRRGERAFRRGPSAGRRRHHSRPLGDLNAAPHRPARADPVSTFFCHAGPQRAQRKSRDFVLIGTSRADRSYIRLT